MWCNTAFNEVAFCALPNEIVTPGAFEELLLSPRQTIRLVEITARALTSGYVGTVEGDPFNTFAFCDGPGGGQTGATRTFYFSDGKFFGRPDDSLRANRRYMPRILSSADIERSLPSDPSVESRGELSFGGIDIANPDGELDYILTDYSPSDQPVFSRVVGRDGYVQDGQIVLVGLGDRWEAREDRITLRLKSVTDYLDKPFHSTYTGQGGINGDASIKGEVKPAAYGPCFNVTPRLINAENWIYQFHDGPAFSVDTVRDGGLDLVNDGDVETYAALLAADVAQGHYLTCLALGLFKAGLGVTGPEWQITADVKGDVDAAGEYSAQRGPILLRIALQRAGLGAEYINKPSFGQLPSGVMGYYSDEAETCSQAFNKLLGGINGYYCPDRTRFLKVGYFRPPNLRTAGRTISNKMALSIEEVPTVYPPLWQQPVRYRKNWTPLTDDQLSDLVGTVTTTATRDELKGEGATDSVTASAIRFTRPDARVGAIIDTFYEESEPAKEVASRVMSFNQEDRHSYRIDMRRINLLLNLDEVVMLQNDRFGLSAGKNALVQVLRDSGKDEGGTVTLQV